MRPRVGEGAELPLAPPPPAGPAQGAGGLHRDSVQRHRLIKSLATGDGFHLQLLLPPLRLGVETLSHLILTKLNHELGRKIIMEGFNLPAQII